MLRRLPSLNALRAFEAAARHESFTKAADELAVTQGAVSHQVKALEEELGLRLFARERQRLLITEAGRSYLEVVRDAFDRLAVGTNQLLQRQTTGILTITTSPNFAAKWLVHRLGRFAEAHPEIDLRLSASLQHVDFAREDIDMAARHGDGNWPGLYATRLCSEKLFPVCSPAFMRGRASLRSPAALKRHTLLHVNDRREWVKWLDAAGVNGIDPNRGPIFNQASMAIDAAATGSCTGAHRACCLGPSCRAAGATFRAWSQGRLRLLDRVPEADRRIAEDSDLSRLAAYGGRRRRAAFESLTL